MTPQICCLKTAASVCLKVRSVHYISVCFYDEKKQLVEFLSCIVFGFILEECGIKDTKGQR